MSTIKSDYGVGGAVGGDALPKVADVLRDIADDLATCQGSAPAALTASAPAAATAVTVATANAATQTASYVQADVQSIAALANALKTAVNALITDNADLRTKLAAAVADLATLRSTQSTRTGSSLKTIKG